MSRGLKYRVFIGQRGNRVFHCGADTKEAAMTALYGWLDLLQRTKLEQGDQAGADDVGQTRGQMASEWKAAVKRRRWDPREKVYECKYGSVMGS